MTDAQALADGLVEAGILNSAWDEVFHTNSKVYWLGDDVHAIYSADEVVLLWAVAGKCLELMRKQGYSWLLHSMPDGKALMTITSPMPNRKEWDAQVVNDNDPLAIVEAFCEALQGDSDE